MHCRPTGYRLTCSAAGSRAVLPSLTKVAVEAPAQPATHQFTLPYAVLATRRERAVVSGRDDNNWGALSVARRDIGPVPFAQGCEYPVSGKVRAPPCTAVEQRPSGRPYSRQQAQQAKAFLRSSLSAQPGRAAISRP